MSSRNSPQIKGFEGLQKREPRFLDAAIQSAFRPGLKLRSRQIQKEFVVADAALFGLPQETLEVASHAGEVERLEIRSQLDQCAGCHCTPPNCP